MIIPAIGPHIHTYHPFKVRVHEKEHGASPISYRANPSLPALNIFVSDGSILFALTHARGEWSLQKGLKYRGESVMVTAMG